MASRCECGRRKGAYAEACDRCTFLDGRGKLQREIIGALRDTDGMTGAEIAVAVGADHQRAIERTMIRLVRDGRIRRRWSEHLGAHVHWEVVA